MGEYNPGCFFRLIGVNLRVTAAVVQPTLRCCLTGDLRGVAEELSVIGDRATDITFDGYIVDIPLSLPPLFENRSSCGEPRYCTRRRYPTGDAGGDFGGDMRGAEANTKPCRLGFITIPWYLRRN